MQFSMHWGQQCNPPFELPHAELGDLPNGASPGIGRGVDAFFCVVSCWQGVKTHKGWLKLQGFQCIRASSVLPPMSCRTLGLAMRQKVHRLALVEACMHFCLVSGL